MDCALKTLSTKGPLEFYTGFPTYWLVMRMGWVGLGEG